MIKLMPLLLSLAVLIGCNQSSEKVTTDMLHFPATASGDGEDEKLPEIEFETPSFNFDKVAEGEIVTHAFAFRNTGKAPLVISKVEGTCGCTVMKDWPKSPIKPGGKGEVIVEFNSNKRPGYQKKTITVLANTVPASNLIYIEGEVVGPTQ